MPYLSLPWRDPTLGAGSYDPASLAAPARWRCSAEGLKIELLGTIVGIIAVVWLWKWNLRQRIERRHNFNTLHRSDAKGRDIGLTAFAKLQEGEMTVAPQVPVAHEPLERPVSGYRAPTFMKNDTSVRVLAVMVNVLLAGTMLAFLTIPALMALTRPEYILIYVPVLPVTIFVALRIVGFEAGYDHRSLIVRKRFSPTREYPWEDLKSVKFDGSWYYVLDFGSHGTAWLMKTLTGGREFLSYANDRLEENLGHRIKQSAWS